MTRDDRLIVVFDGQCGLCQSSVSWLQRFDPDDRHLRYVPYQDEETLAEIAPEVDPRRADTEMLVRAPDGSVHGGFYGIRRLSRVLPRLWWAVPFLHFPLLSGVLGPRVYRFIARHRRKIMGSAVCQIPARR